MLPIIGFLVVFAIFILSTSIRILNEYERGVVFRLGRSIGVKGPGLILLIPMVDRMVKVSLRTVVLDVPPQDVITRDNVSLQVNAVVFFRVMDPERSILDVENYMFATSQLSQTTLRSVLGQISLDEILAERDKINDELQQIIDRQTDPWGIKVSLVELKHVDLPQEMKRAMSRQAEAERERRAKIIAAEGERQAADQLTEAASVIARHPEALQLRYLQTLVEIAAENNSVTVFPIPMELLRPFMQVGHASQPVPPKPEA